MTTYVLKTFAVLISAACVFAMCGAYKSTSAVQVGNAGMGMEVVETNARLAAKVKLNEPPVPLPAAPTGGQLSVDAYKNVQVLGHITSGEMTRLMTAMTIWVAPKQGCAYCHAPLKDKNGVAQTDEDGNPQADPNNLNSDDLYTKRVARRMLQMTMHLNSDWKSHVQDTGVTCYTCHRGNPVPTEIWYDQPQIDEQARAMGNSAGKNKPSVVAGLSSLPNDPFRPFLAGDEGIRVVSTAPLPIDNRLSIKQTEWTYSLMIHFSKALGVNCTHCHNMRSVAEWNLSPPARAQAWYGIRMVRDLNNNYLEPLQSTFPAARLGPAGDGPKLNCATCHQGAFKPLLGANMLKDYTVLAEAKPQPQKTVAAPSAPADVGNTLSTPKVEPAALPPAPQPNAPSPVPPPNPTATPATPKP